MGKFNFKSRRVDFTFKVAFHVDGRGVWTYSSPDMTENTIKKKHRRQFEYLYIDTERLRQARDARDWTQQEVASMLGCSFQLIHRLEVGRTASIQLLCEVADLYDLDLTDFIFPRPKKEPLHVQRAAQAAKKRRGIRL